MKRPTRTQGYRTVEAFNKIADGELDEVAEQAFFMCGGLEDVERKWADIKKSL